MVLPWYVSISLRYQIFRCITFSLETAPEISEMYPLLYVPTYVVINLVLGIEYSSYGPSWLADGISGARRPV